MEKIETIDNWMEEGEHQGAKLQRAVDKNINLGAVTGVTHFLICTLEQDVSFLSPLIPSPIICQD